MAATIARTDGDGITDYNEYIADTNPFDLTSFFRITIYQPTFNASNLLTMTQVTWNSSDRRIYDIQATINLTAPPFADLLSNIPGASGQATTSRTFADSATPPDKKFYRVKAKLPLKSLSGGKRSPSHGAEVQITLIVCRQRSLLRAKSTDLCGCF